MSLNASLIRKKGYIRTLFFNIAKDSGFSIQSIIDLNFDEETNSDGEEISVWNLYSLLDSFEEDYMYENDELLLTNSNLKTLFESLGYEIKSIKYNGEIVLRQLSFDEYQDALLSNPNCNFITSLKLMAFVAKKYDIFETLSSVTNLEALEIGEFLKILDNLNLFYDSENESFEYNPQR